ncbi:MAG: glycosyltransferase family 2 protein [Myxococcota bacterium]|jgi:dolichyl-phosphate beta-glucosyltransferase|nr:glycosyltransferase family 2 protein [Myxococcota bacterium]
MDLSIVVPAFNEAERLPQTLPQFAEWMEGTGLEVELLVVDDGSTDETASVVKAFAQGEPRVRLLSYQPNRGKGHAVGVGVAAAQGREILFSDADLSMPLSEVSKLRQALQEAEIAIASRVQHTQQDAPPRYRRIMGRLFNAWVQLVAIKGIQDTQCGFKLFRADVAKKLFSLRKLDRFAFDVELLYLAQRLAMRVVEVPVIWSHSGGSKVMPLRDASEMFVAVLRIRKMHRRIDLGSFRSG